MTNDVSKPDVRTHMIGVRVNAEQKALVALAAEREGLQLSSFIIMVLVRVHVLPESSFKKLKRRPVPYFNVLHDLLGIVNKIGGNCKQLAVLLPDTEGLYPTYSQLLRTAAALTDVLHGRKVPEGVNFYRLQADLTKVGHAFNQIVKSVNTGHARTYDEPMVLRHITRCCLELDAALKGGCGVGSIREQMKRAGQELTKPRKERT